jgi:hypothetical protein
MVAMENTLFWVLMPCSLIQGYQSTWHHSLQRSSIHLIICSGVIYLDLR